VTKFKIRNVAPLL